MNISDMFPSPSSYFTCHSRSLLTHHAVKLFDVTQDFLMNEITLRSIFLALPARLSSFGVFGYFK